MKVSEIETLSLYLSTKRRNYGIGHCSKHYYACNFIYRSNGGIYMVAAAGDKEG